MGRLKRITAALIALILVLLCAFTAAEDPYDPEYTELWVICKPNSFVYVRMGPRKLSSNIGWLECGDRVYTDGIKKGRYMHCVGLTLEDGEGWVHAGYLVSDEPVKMNGEIYRINATGRVAIRRTVNGARRAWAKNGKTVRVYAISEEWTLTNRGFIRSEFLEPDPE